MACGKFLNLVWTILHVDVRSVDLDLEVAHIVRKSEKVLVELRVSLIILAQQMCVPVVKHKDFLKFWEVAGFLAQKRFKENFCISICHYYTSCEGFDATNKNEI